MPSIEVGVNIVSLAYVNPRYNRLFASPSQMIELAQEIGFAFVMALPLCGATGLEESIDFIRFYEQAWNPTTPWGFITRQWGKEGPPRLEDILLFPDPERCAKIASAWGKRGAEEIGHDFSSARLVEVSPRLDMGPNTIFRKCDETGCRLVVDTHHLQRGYRKDEIALNSARISRSSPLGRSLGNWLTDIEIWRPHLADVMHLNIDPQKFLAGQEQDAIEMLMCWLEQTKHHEKRHIVLEYRPPVILSTNRELAKAMLDKTWEVIWPV